MKKEELLLFKEDLAKIKKSRYSLLEIGIFIVIIGIFFALLQIVVETPNVARGIRTFTLLPEIILIVFGAIGIICCIVASLKYDKDYENKLKELKKVMRIKS